MNKRFPEYIKSNEYIMNNPLTYCLDESINNEFNHGAISKSISGPNSKNCQAFMSEYCAQNGWNNICEIASRNIGTNHPNNLLNCTSGCQPVELTDGEILIYNTATRKYLVNMIGNCHTKYEQFDPTVSSSPFINYWQGDCIPVYEVDPNKIDNDPVMNKILEKPIIALKILVNIYNTAIRLKKINNLRNTKIYNFFMSKQFQLYINKQYIMKQPKSCCNGK